MPFMQGEETNTSLLFYRYAVGEDDSRPEYRPDTGDRLSLLFDINDLLVLSETDGSTLFNPFYNTPPDECSGTELCIRNCSFLI